MSAVPATILSRIRLLRVAARKAQEAEAQAHAARGYEAEAGFWNEFDEANATIHGLILSPEGAAHLDALERLLEGRS